jgi:hypothetical protein
MGKGPVTLAEVIGVAVALRDVCERLEPSAIGLHETPVVFDHLTAMELLAAGAVLRMAARYEEAGAWKEHGDRSVEDVISRKTGTGSGKARRKLETSRRLRDQPKTDDAVRRGEVSGDQATEVSKAAAVAPEAEDELLASARHEPLHQLQKRAAEAQARADKDREATRRRLHSQRQVRRWDDADGMGNLLLKMPAAELRELDASLKTAVDRRLADARHAGRFEPVEAYAADEVMDRLLGRTGGSNGTKTSGQAVRSDKKVVCLIDIDALNRGRVEGGETCEIAGVGPVSVSAAQRLMGDAFWAIVIRDGVDVVNVTHLGRRVTAQQRTALEARGARCEFCGSLFRVEIDHVEGWALTHRTEVDDLSLKCWSCHEAKGRLKLKETGPPGDRRFLNPDGTPWHRPVIDDHEHEGPGPPGDPPADPPARLVQDELFTLAT